MLRLQKALSNHVSSSLHWKKKARESPACFGGSWTMPLMSHNIVAIKRSEYLDNWWNILMTKWKPPKHKEIIGIGRLGRFVKFLPISIRRRSTTKPTKIYCSFKGSGISKLKTIPLWICSCCFFSISNHVLKKDLPIAKILIHPDNCHEWTGFVLTSQIFPWR